MTAPASRPDRKDGKAPNRGFWPLRDIPTLFWLLLVVVAVIAHRWLPVPGWLMLHLLLLGAVTHAILVWSQYFSFALTHSSPTVAERRGQSWRLGLSNGGAALVIAGVMSGAWPITLVGAASLIIAVLWHGVNLLARLRRGMPGRFARTIWYYVAAAGMLAVGAAIGAGLARDSGNGDLVLSHAVLNVLGWIGLTVAGTLVTLWPSILRTRADDRAAAGAARALPVLALGVLGAAGGAAAGIMTAFVLGLVFYTMGLAMIGVSMWRAARKAPPRSFAAMSVGLGFGWWAGGVVALIVAAIASILSGGESEGVKEALDQLAPFLAAGFAAQVLVGALSYLVPVVLGGGPTPVRIGTAAFDKAGPLRITAANVALLVCALPVSSLMRVGASFVYFAAMAAFLPIMVMAMRAQRRAKESGAKLTEFGTGPIVPEGERPRGLRAGQAAAGLLSVVLVVAVCAAIDPVSLPMAGPAAEAAQLANAPVKTVKVEAANMRFTPNRIEVPAGTHLKIVVENTDKSQVHDLVLQNGARGSRLQPGSSETVDVGVVTADVAGWCSIVGHRQMGMTLKVEVVGTVASPTPTATGKDGMAGMDHGSAGMDHGSTPAAGFTPYDAVLPPLPASTTPVTHRLTLTVADKKVEVAPGITQTLWMYNGTAPGPVLHGRVGDTFVVTLVNHGTMGHSIDFHAGAVAPDGPMRTIAPGRSLTYTFTATRSGIWMYHCSTMPMTAHIASGMYGAVVIEPKNLPKVDRSYVLVQGEYYLGDHDGGEVDTDKIAADKPDLVVFNGYANQYDHAPLQAKVGERVRVWVLDAGPDRPSSFHVVGGQFDTVWSEGRYLIDRATDTGSQALGLAAAQGGFVELTFPEAGHYPFVSHYMIDAERGAHGIFDVR